MVPPTARPGVETIEGGPWHSINLRKAISDDRGESLPRGFPAARSPARYLSYDFRPEN
jgi:hypothetical protein